ncbi:MAG: GspH/FimT family pseudopilin [Pseudomonadota bacterium]
MSVTQDSLNDGFTLLELMLTIAVLAVVVVLAAPSFDGTIRTNRTVQANNDLVSALAVARSEAIKRGERVSVCPTVDQTTCDGSGNWELGWMVFVDPGNPGNVDAGEPVLRVWDAITNGTTIRAAGSFSDFVSFAPSGETRATPNNFDSFFVCDQDSNLAEGRTVNVALLGYARTQKGAAACP